MEFLKKPYRWAIIITIIIIAFSTFVLLDTFVIPKSKETVENYNSDSNTTINESDTTKETEAVVSENSYSDDNIEISIETERKNKDAERARLCGEVTQFETAIAELKKAANAPSTQQNENEDPKKKKQA